MRRNCENIPIVVYKETLQTPVKQYCTSNSDEERVERKLLHTRRIRECSGHRLAQQSLFCRAQARNSRQQWTCTQIVLQRRLVLLQLATLTWRLGLIVCGHSQNIMYKLPLSAGCYNYSLHAKCFHVVHTGLERIRHSAGSTRTSGELGRLRVKSSDHHVIQTTGWSCRWELSAIVSVNWSC